LKFYGPVVKGPGSTPAIAVDYDDQLVSPPVWRAIPHPDFTVTFNGRDMAVSPNTLLDWDGMVRYRIRPLNIICDPSVVPGNVTVPYFEHILYP